MRHTEARIVSILKEHLAGTPGPKHVVMAWLHTDRDYKQGSLRSFVQHAPAHTAQGVHLTDMRQISALLACAICNV